MKVEIGEEYLDGWGSRFRVMGLTADNKKWVWTLQGNWYRQSDGRKITCYEQAGNVPMEKPTLFDLVAVVERRLR